MNLLKGKKSGITLIEALIVIALGIGLIAAGLVLFSSGQNTNKVKDESSNLGQIYSKLNSIYQSDAVPSTVQEDAVKAGVFGKTLRVNPTTFVVNNSWEGTVVLEDESSGLGFSVTYTNVPEGQPCVDLVNATRKTGFKRVGIANSGTKVSPGSLISAMTPTSIITACGTGNAQDAVVITWYSTNS